MFRVKGVRGEVFALLTLAVTFVLGTIIVNTPIDGGSGVSLAAVAVPKIGPTPSATFYLLALAAATLTMLIAWWVAVSKLGAGLFAIHDDEDAAEVMGVPTYRYKLIALAISCALAGLAGGIHALFLNYVTVGEIFNITVPLTVVLMSVLGGSRHWAGPAIGAVAITLLLYSFTAADFAVAGKAVVGAILVAAVLFMPDGILPRVQKALQAAPRAGAAGRADARGGADGAARRGAAAGARPAEVVQGRARARRRRRAGAARRDPRPARAERLRQVDLHQPGQRAFQRQRRRGRRSKAGELTGLPAHRIASAGIARTYQIPRPFAHLSVLDNVALATMFGGGEPKPRAGRAARRCAGSSSPAWPTRRWRCPMS